MSDEEPVNVPGEGAADQAGEEEEPGRDEEFVVVNGRDNELPGEDDDDDEDEDEDEYEEVEVEVVEEVEVEVSCDDDDDDDDDDNNDGDGGGDAEKNGEAAGVQETAAAQEGAEEEEEPADAKEHESGEDDGPGAASAASPDEDSEPVRVLSASGSSSSIPPPLPAAAVAAAAAKRAQVEAEEAAVKEGAEMAKAEADAEAAVAAAESALAVGSSLQAPEAPDDARRSSVPQRPLPPPRPASFVMPPGSSGPPPVPPSVPPRIPRKDSKPPPVPQPPSRPMRPPRPPTPNEAKDGGGSGGGGGAGGVANGIGGAGGGKSPAEARRALKSALVAKDVDALEAAIKTARLSGLGASDAVLRDAESAFVDLRESRSVADLETTKFYLKQAMELKNREGLRMALDKADKLHLPNRRMHVDFNILVADARKALESLAAEEKETLSFYLKQGLQLRNRDVLKQTMEKVAVLQHQQQDAGLDMELVARAQAMLAQLDAESLMSYYLESATKQKDYDGLQSAIAKARALKMTPHAHPALGQAQTMLANLEKKRNRGSQKGGGFFGRLKKGGTGGKKAAGAAGGGGGGGGGGAGGSLSKTAVFGVPLAVAVARSPYTVPKIAHECVEFLRKSGMQEPGVFRVPGNRDIMNALKAKADSGDSAEVKLEAVADAAGLFKNYLRSLPEPLVPFAYYKKFLDCAARHPKRADPSGRVLAFGNLVGQLPRVNRASLSHLMHFLHDLAQNVEATKMGPNNLAIVFAPNLLRPEEETAQSMLTEMPATIDICCTLIEQVVQIFGEPQPVEKAAAAAAKKE